MPKMKSKRAATKRFKLTAKGHVKRSKAYHSHLLGKKSAKRKRSLKQAALVFSGFEKQLKQLLQQ